MNRHKLPKRLIIQKLLRRDPLGRLISKPLVHHLQYQFSLPWPNILPGTIQKVPESVSWDSRVIIPLAPLLFGVMMRPLVTTLPLLRQRSEHVEHATQDTGVAPPGEGVETGHHCGEDAHEAPHVRLVGGLETLVEELWGAASFRREAVVCREGVDAPCQPEIA